MLLSNEYYRGKVEGFFKPISPLHSKPLPCSCKTLNSEPLFRKVFQAHPDTYTEAPCLTLPDFQNLPKRRLCILRILPGRGTGVLTRRIWVINPPVFDVYACPHLQWTRTAHCNHRPCPSPCHWNNGW